MDFNEANIKRLEGILKTLDLGVSKEELKNILERMAAVVLKIEKRNAEVITDLQTQHAKLLKDAKEDLSTSEKELKKKVDYLFVQERLDALSTEHKERMDAVKAMLTRLERRIEEIKDGDPGAPGDKGDPGDDGSPDTPEEIRNKLESISKNEDKLSIDAIRDLREELKKIYKLLSSNKGGTVYVGGSGGATGGKIVKSYDLSASLDGVTKTFALPAFWRVISVHLSSFPGILRPTTDYTTDGTNMTITFTSEISAASSLASGQSLLIVYSEA